MYENLTIINWPDPRLKKVSVPVTTFDDNLKALAARMIQLMHDHGGVGLAAPQVGLNIRLFVANHTGEQADDAVYINPVLDSPEGTEEGDEGCLSLPGIRTTVDRNQTMRIRAQDLDGKPIEKLAIGFEARIWQHETDHLDAILILDRMGPVAKMSAKRKLRELEEQFGASAKRK